MSLLALMADKFELEPPPHNDEVKSVNDDEVDNDLHGKRGWKEELSGNKRGDDDHDEYYLPTQSGPLLVSYDDNGKANGTDIPTDANATSDNDDEQKKKQETKLLITFLLMVVIGTANKIFQKLQAIPMYNYPNTLNLLINFVYVPLCFAYIIPVSRFGLLNNAIPAEVTVMSKRPFVIMGLLDCITCMLLTFASVYLPGSLLILLPQAAIPISMAFSKKLKGESYKMYQYFGAFVVILGIFVVLEPLLTSRHSADYVCEAYDEEEFCALCSDEIAEEGCLSHRTKMSLVGLGVGGNNAVAPWEEATSQTNLVSLMSSLIHVEDSSESSTIDHQDGASCRWVSSDATTSSSSESTTATLIWSVVTILACIPMTLSSIYKEMTLSGDSNNIDPIFLNGYVAFYQFIFSFPLAFPAGMTSDPPVSPRELPANIFAGIKCYLGISTIETGCHPDDQCHESPFYVNMFLAFNICFNILIVYILKFGSANVLFMAGTVMVPIGNLAFALPFMPGSQPLHDSDVAGLMVILLGLVTYRFGDSMKCRFSRLRSIPPLPWRLGKFRRNPMLNPESFEWNAPVFDDETDLNAPSSQLEEPLLSPLD